MLLTMADATVTCPDCSTRQEVETDEYGIFTLVCENCGARSKGEYTATSGEVIWRWTQPGDKSSD